MELSLFIICLITMAVIFFGRIIVKQNKLFEIDARTDRGINIFLACMFLFTCLLAVLKLAWIITWSFIW